MCPGDRVNVDDGPIGLYSAIAVPWSDLGLLDDSPLVGGPVDVRVLIDDSEEAGTVIAQQARDRNALIVAKLQSLAEITVTVHMLPVGVMVQWNRSEQAGCHVVRCLRHACWCTVTDG